MCQHQLVNSKYSVKYSNAVRIEYGLKCFSGILQGGLLGHLLFHTSFTQGMWKISSLTLFPPTCSTLFWSDMFWLYFDLLILFPPYLFSDGELLLAWNLAQLLRKLENILNTMWHYFSHVIKYQHFLQEI